MPPRTDRTLEQKGRIFWKRPLAPNGPPRGEFNARNFEAIQKALRKEISSKGSEIALCLVTCNEEIQKTSGRIRVAFPKPTATQAEFLTDWRRLANNYDQAISQTRLFAVDGSSTLGDFLSSVLPYLLDPTNSDSDKELQAKSYLEMLSSAGAREEELKPKLTEVIDEMDRFQDHWSTNDDFTALLEPSNVMRGRVRSLLEKTQFEGQMTTLLDNSSLPGFMAAMLGLVSGDLVRRLNNLLEGESQPRIDVESEASNIQRLFSTFDCLMDVRSILRMDLLAAAKQIREGILIDSTASFEGRSKVVTALYKDLENALKDFATSLADGAQAKMQTNTADGAPTRSRFAQFFRRLWFK